MLAIAAAAAAAAVKDANQLTSQTSNEPPTFSAPYVV
jgi:hypothetical protein